MVVCTAHPQPVVVAAQLGAADYLLKPSAPDEVLAIASAHPDALAAATDRQRAAG